MISFFIRVALLHLNDFSRFLLMTRTLVLPFHLYVIFVQEKQLISISKIVYLLCYRKSCFKEFWFCLRGYHTLQGDNSLKSVERFDHMMFVCRFQASRWSKPQREKLLCGQWIHSSESVGWNLLKFWYLLQWIYSNTLPKK
jgi:hypothetical protein